MHWKLFIIQKPCGFIIPVFIGFYSFVAVAASKPILLAVIWPVELSLNIVKRQFWRIKTTHCIDIYI